MPNPWKAHYPTHAKGVFEAPLQNASDSLYKAARKHPERVCLNFLGKEYTYADIAVEACKVASGLEAIGIQKGDRVALCLPNTPYYLTCYFAILRMGGVVVNCNPLYTQEELEHLFTDSGAKLVITLNVKTILPKVSKAMAGKGRVVGCDLALALPQPKQTLFKLLKFTEIAKLPKDENHLPYEELLSHGHEPDRISNVDPQKDLAVLQYTGGTTGVPKGAMLTHYNIVANTEQAHNWVGKENLKGQRFLAVLPFFHVFAMTALLNLPIRAGGTIIALPRYDLLTTLKTIHKEKPAFFGGVPTIFNAISQYKKIAKFDLSSIKFCISGGAGLPKAVKHNFEALTGCTLVEGYGLSEASPVLACNPLVKDGKTGSIGLPMPGTEIELRDLKNPEAVVEQGRNGELVARGPQVMAGYWKNEEATKDTMLPGGWLRTGDVGYMSPEGYFFLEDRIKDLIICSGYNVYPRVVERAFYKHPAVAEVTVIGIEDEYRGEAPKAFVVLKDGEQVSEKELFEFVKEHLNPLEKPAKIEIRKELPKTLIGKLSKKELVAEEAEKQSKEEV